MVRVIKPGFFSTIQDIGRIGYQHYGVPYSGVMDAYSASIANAILGNKKHAAVIEMSMTGATLEFKSDTNICISGADMSPQLNSVQIKRYKSIPVKANDVLLFGKTNFGFRSYLAVQGGFDTEIIMNSRSMYGGITNKHVLCKNDELPIPNLAPNNIKHARIKVKTDHFITKYIEVFKGPEFDLLSFEQQEKLFSLPYTITKENNRMAYQLKETLENNLPSIITSSVLPGTVQLTPSGKLIILMRDCQITGGYPRVLQLKEASINVLAQKFTNQSIVFKRHKY